MNHMKKLNILYWVFTALFAAFMLFSAIDNIRVTEGSVVLFESLGYPRYLIAFMGVAKLLGVIGILLPGFPRLTEWAYAGLFFDLIGATYSVLTAQEFHPMTLTMIIPFALGALSYVYYHKRLAARQTQTA